MSNECLNCKRKFESEYVCGKHFCSNYCEGYHFGKQDNQSKHKSLLEQVEKLVGAMKCCVGFEPFEGLEPRILSERLADFERYKKENLSE